MTFEQSHKQGGFTLVELAIVMIIIGLLIGGILKGQELIANAQVTATIAQIKGLDGAIATFRDKYRQLPGDMRDPQNRLRDCAAVPCNDGGNGNGRVDEPANLGTVPTAAQEGAVAFVHMAAADLISGVIIDDATVAFGVMLPEAEMGGGFWLGFTANGTAQGGATGMRPGHYLVMNGVPQNAGGLNGVANPSQAAQIDRKIDDGVPDSGTIQAVGTQCVQAGEYNEDETAASCSLYIRV